MNQLIGDNAFWNGLRRYTSNQWGQAATNQDHQMALDGADTGNRNINKKGDASGRKGNAKTAAKPLDNLFDLWVYGLPNTDSGSKSR